MNEKEEIRNNPWKVVITTHRHYSKWKMHIEIEDVSREDNLFLFPKQLGYFRGGNLHHVHQYDADGRMYFERQIPNFGKVWIHDPEGNNIIEFDDYESLLNEITSDL